MLHVITIRSDYSGCNVNEMKLSIINKRPNRNFSEGINNFDTSDFIQVNTPQRSKYFKDIKFTSKKAIFGRILFEQGRYNLMLQYLLYINLKVRSNSSQLSTVQNFAWNRLLVGGLYRLANILQTEIKNREKVLINLKALITTRSNYFLHVFIYIQPGPFIFYMCLVRR